MLLPPPCDNVYDTCEELKTELQQHTAQEGYTITTVRSLKKHGEIFKIYYMCAQGSKPCKSTARIHLNTCSIRVGCEFRCYAVNNKQLGGWVIVTTQAEHNHNPSEPGAHWQHRLSSLTAARRSEIAHGMRAGLQTSQTLSQMRIDNPSICLGKRDIYNARALIHRQKLRQMTPIQALMEHLSKPEWRMQYQKNAADQITHLFLCHEASFDLIRSNPQVLLMDCTYKTNQYKLPLLIITGITPLNSTFYVAFSFLEHKKEPDYTFLLKALQQTYINFNLPDPRIILSDDDKALQNSIAVVYPHSINLLCIWHVNKNIKAHLKKLIRVKELVDEAMALWMTVLQANTEEELEEHWAQLKSIQMQILHLLPI